MHVYIQLIVYTYNTYTCACICVSLCVYVYQLYASFIDTRSRDVKRDMHVGER